MRNQRQGRSSRLRGVPLSARGGGGGGGGLAVSGSAFTANGVATANAKDVPTETLTGDLLIAFTFDHTNISNTEGTGNWNFEYEIGFATLMHTSVWSFIATEDGNHVDNKPTLSGHGNGSYCTIISIPGASQTFDVAAIGGHDGVTSGYPYTGANNFTFPGVTTVTDGALVIAHYAQDDDYTPINPTEWDGDGSWEFVCHNASSSGTDGMSSVGSWLTTTAGSTTDPENITGGWNAYRKEVVTLAVKPS